LFSNDEELAAALLAAGERSLDLAWRMPVNDEYGESLRSNFADFANSGTRDGGASVAANFLARFVDGLKWAHLDIAGVAWRSNSNKGATGRPVPLLVDFLLNLSARDAG
jgi:leucyl aminopeptidase